MLGSLFFPPQKWLCLCREWITITSLVRTAVPLTGMGVPSIPLASAPLLPTREKHAESECAPYLNSHFPLTPHMKDKLGSYKADRTPRRLSLGTWHLSDLAVWHGASHRTSLSFRFS